MDQTDQYHNLRTLSQLIKLQFLKKVTQLLLSVSVFSFFMFHSSLLSFFQSYNLYFSKYLLQLFSHAIDKNCIFLLCNGLLVFLAKLSGLTRFLSGSTQNEESFKSMEDGLQPESSIPETKEAMLLKEAIETSGWAEKIALEQVREINYLIQGTEKEDKKSSVEEGGGGGDSRFLIEEEEEVAAAEEEETGILALEDEKEETFVGVEEEEEEENGS
ncbi:hypothetical protein CJ030_MR8G005076 [Morella rubra]|uniref:Uncharacterized protein n=1 Tax=Morella rubra TaxID=262757 RepID=A0A6A1UXM9_9ROSI|nr:hypothetical protein CJ030_MR8G005076 [Morella rubra]